MTRVLLVLMIAVVAEFTLAAEPFPLRPDPRLTPGSYCKSPARYRYPARVAYCDRSVSVDEKQSVFAKYRALGYVIDLRDRDKFKIDHLIPLCAGGGNEASNLWPQHYTLFEKTDMVESLACQALSEGHISQKDAVQAILRAKMDIRQVDEIITILERMQ